MHKMHPFTKRLLLLVSLSVAASLTVFTLTSIAKYKPYGVPDLLREEWEARQYAIRAIRDSWATGDEQSEVAQGPHPIVAVDSTQHDFGTLDAGTSAQHTFVIRNEGDAPLAISAAGTSCKCTLSKTSAELIAPGEAADVTLTWNTGQSRGFFRQHAVIRTNDRHRREIELAVSGQIQTQLGFSTDELLAPNVNPERGAEAETIVFSQTLADFEITGVQCTLPGFRFRLEPVGKEVLQRLEATSAWRLCVSTDASLESGDFVDAVHVTVESNQIGGDEPLTQDILFRGRVRSPITFYGSGLVRDKGLELGVMRAGDEVKSHVIVRVRGNDLPKGLEISRAEPSILNAEVIPLNTRPGTYKLTITVPRDAPQTVFNNEQSHGYLEVRDPDNPSFRSSFPIYGAVLEY